MFNAPLSVARADRLVDVLELEPGARVLDAGCGSGRFLLRLVERTGADGLGVDVDAAAIASAREEAARRLAPGSRDPAASSPTAGTCAFRDTGLPDDTLERGSFDAAVCIGSTHAFGLGDGAYERALDALSALVRPGGLLLVGDGYWKRPPDAEYLAFLGEPTGIDRDHAGNVGVGVARGLVPLHACVSDDDEWDEFEWGHRRRIEREAAAHPDDPAWSERLAKSRAWRDAYLRWGRTTMGFGFYVFRTPRDG